MQRLFRISIIAALIGTWACSDDDTTTPSTPDNNYTGTGSVTQGMATTVTSNLLGCGRVAGIGTITDTDNNAWTVPADVNYTDSNFPFASEMNNPCSGVIYNSAAEAVAALDGSDIIELDATGEVITAYIFADNYFEMYINGTPVGKDNVPFTDFNSDIVRFKVKRPFTVAMLLVDWEENLGVGSENNRGFSYSPGDGGMVAVFADTNGNIIGTTDNTWKAQTFYTAPVKDLMCLSENGTKRLSTNCDAAGSNDGTSYYAVHWAIPSGWMNKDYDDSEWPAATTYTNDEIGVDNKSSYTNYTDIFDDANHNAQFIWSTNVVLDNEVIVRKTIQ
ncbi:hypothetical protein JMN32_03805 [Fulvivirga sp. 29W222]|uniref:Uncharacterized protein n=1 Tax=Fulvivirga marina TaxID=2494733 RepID=A0A937FW49_9BACT|nr:hypothetical protein [Fulvivirga marina]MBL6445416.1 hypothetical protein [Fulvivirga marina]